ncbi:MAG: L,D-transpeptidase family protein [Pseudomonadota bacterium]
MSDFSRREVLSGLAASAAVASLPTFAQAQGTAFKQAVAEAAARDRDIATFYKHTGYAGIWTGKGGRDKARRQHLIDAVAKAAEHGLPRARYDPAVIETNVRRLRRARDLGVFEVEMSRLFLQYARDVQTGMTSPRRIDEQMVRKVPYRPRDGLLNAFSKSTPRAFIRALPPQTDEYTRLMKAKLDMERVVGKGGWGGEVRAKKLERGQSSEAVVALRNRLIRMGYLKRNSSAVFDDRLMRALATFQHEHGLRPDGVAGPATLKAINASAEWRLATIHVAMERERWMNDPRGRGDRHVYVNLPDFRTRLFDKGKVTFETKSVVGSGLFEKRTPEFSDNMEYMEINPDWTVPRSILGRDYLPKLQEDRYAARYLELTDINGRLVSRDEVDFAQYTEETFPFTVRQPPGRENALGTVKFMFPNPHAIYLHDTPERHLFQRDIRMFSAGCIRLFDPHDFAYVLLRRQMSNPEPYFQRILASGQQTIVPLDESVPVHLDYRTAFTEPKGRTQFRSDIYGRDAKVWAALEQAGVALRAVRG